MDLFEIMAVLGGLTILKVLTKYLVAKNLLSIFKENELQEIQGHPVRRDKSARD